MRFKKTALMNRDFHHHLAQIVEENLSSERFGPEDLAQKSGMSYSTLHRRLRETSNQTIGQFIREIRLKKAGELLLSEDTTVSEVAYKVGFGSPNYFNKCFHEYYGISPGEYKKNHVFSDNHEAAIETDQAPPVKKTYLSYFFTACADNSVFGFSSQREIFFLGKSCSTGKINCCSAAEISW